MWDATAWAAVVGPITTMMSGLGGYLLAGRNEEKRDQRTAAREDASRRAALTERLADQRHEIQRQTLTEVQDELRRLSRVTFQIIRYDRNTIREQGAPASQIPEELDSGFFESMQNVGRLRSRILDQNLRNAVDSFTACTSVLIEHRDRPAQDLVNRCTQRMDELNARFTALNDELGVHVRRGLDRLGTNTNLPDTT
jgi:hypothetical protein